MAQETISFLYSLTEQFSSSSKNPQNTENLPHHAKLAVARQILERLHLKLPYLVDLSAQRELNRIDAILEEDFIQQRAPHHLAKISYSIALVRKKLSFLHLKSSYDVRLSPFSLHFTFGSKPVLGILVHANMKNKYEAFDEEHILLRIRKCLTEAQLVNGSTYEFTSSKSAIKTIYFEIDKKSGLTFTCEEIKKLKTLLKQEIEFCVEQLAPQVFMTRNDEEICKNILVLTREVQKAPDLPEVMILMDKQTLEEAVFTIILVRVCKTELPIVAEEFAKIQGFFTFFPERCQVIENLSEKDPIEANVFRIHLPKDPSLLRANLSLHFYHARQQITHLLQQAIGEFRDFNGGLIFKQREVFNALIESFSDISLQNHDLLENFFHAIEPAEAQAYLPLKVIETLFKLLLESIRFTITSSFDYFCQFEQMEDNLFFMIRLPDEHFKTNLEKIFTKLHVNHSQIVTSTLHLENSALFGYLVTAIPPTIQEQVKKEVTEELLSWKQKMQSKKILKIGLEHSVFSLDPRIGGDYLSSILLKMLVEGLMRENMEGTIECGIANSVEVSPDLKTYLFKLRNALWSDGTLITAFDFEYAWKKVLSPKFKTPFAYLFYPIKNAELAKKGEESPDTIGIHALDETTLKVELRCPTPYFLELTAHTIYSPVSHIVDQLHPNWPHEEGNRYVCNGAFQLTKNKPNEGYELSKNPLYWDEKQIKLDQINITKINRYQAFEWFEKNNNHMVGIPLTTWDPRFIPSERDEQVGFISKALFWCSFNCKKPPFDNKKIRQVFSLAINREEIASLMNTLPAFSPLPRQHSLIKDSPLSHFNPQKAKMLFTEALEEMLLSREIFPSIKLLHLKTGTQLAELIKKYWETAFSVECTLIPLKWDLLFEKITEGDYDVGYLCWEALVNDPMYTLSIFKESKEPLNFPKWENRKYQEILDLAENEIDPQKREKFYLEAETILLEEMPITPIYSNKRLALKKRALKVQYFDGRPNFKWADFV